MANIANSLLVSILIKGRILTPYGIEVGPVKHIVKLIANILGATKINIALVTWEGRLGKPALLHRQSM